MDMRSQGLNGVCPVADSKTKKLFGSSWHAVLIRSPGGDQRATLALEHHAFRVVLLQPSFGFAFRAKPTCADASQHGSEAWVSWADSRVAFSCRQNSRAPGFQQRTGVAGGWVSGVDSRVSLTCGQIRPSPGQPQRTAEP
jgi:hypothetical protein